MITNVQIKERSDKSLETALTFGGEQLLIDPILEPMAVTRRRTQRGQVRIVPLSRFM
jgi:hypothetical protein